MDISLHYQEKGNKEPFALLHGNGEDGSYFRHQIDYFSDIYRVIALDTRGHGKSPRGTDLLRLSGLPATYTILWQTFQFQKQLS